MRSRRDPLPTWFTAGSEGSYDNGFKRGSRPDFVSEPHGTYRRGGS